MLETISECKQLRETTPLNDPLSACSFTLTTSNGLMTIASVSPEHRPAAVKVYNKKQNCEILNAVIFLKQWRIQDFPREGGEPTYDFAKFFQKLHEIERIWSPGGARAPRAPPLNLPLIIGERVGAHPLDLPLTKNNRAFEGRCC